jgi:hypothetical protein
LKAGVGFLGGPFTVARGCLAFGGCPNNATAATLHVFRSGFAGLTGPLAGTDNIVAVAAFDNLAANDNGTTILDLGNAKDGYDGDAADRGVLVDEGAGTWFSFDLNVSTQYTPGGTTQLTICNKTYDVDGADPTPLGIGLYGSTFAPSGDNAPYLEVTYESLDSPSSTSTSTLHPPYRR